LRGWAQFLLTTLPLGPSFRFERSVVVLVFFFPFLGLSRPFFYFLVSHHFLPSPPVWSGVDGFVGLDPVGPRGPDLFFPFLAIFCAFVFMSVVSWFWFLFYVSRGWRLCGFSSVFFPGRTLRRGGVELCPFPCINPLARFLAPNFTFFSFFSPLNFRGFFRVVWAPSQKLCFVTPVTPLKSLSHRFCSIFFLYIRS